MTYRERAARTRRWLRPLPGGWWLDGVLLAGLVALTVALVAGTGLLRLDVEVARWCDAHRPYPAYLVARGLNYLGQGTPLTLLTAGLAVWRCRTTRSVRPILVPVVAFGLTYLSIGPLKVLCERPAPHYTGVAHPERLFAVPGTLSYPSGHVANSLVWYTALVIVLGAALHPRWRRVLRTVPVLVVVATTTYLGWHWATDGVAGALLGCVLLRVLLRVRWDEVPLGGRLAARGWDGPAGLGTRRP